MYHVPECSCVFYPSSASVKSNTGRIESTTTSRQLRLLSLCDPFISYFQTNGSPGINDIENGAASCENAPLWTVMIGMASTRYQDWNHRLVACSDKVSVFKSEGNRLTVQIHASQDGITRQVFPVKGSDWKEELADTHQLWDETAKERDGLQLALRSPEKKSVGRN